MNFLASPAGAVWLIALTVFAFVLCAIFMGLAASSDRRDKIPRGVWIILVFLFQLAAGVFSLGATVSIVMNLIRYAKHV